MTYEDKLDETKDEKDDLLRITEIKQQIKAIEAQLSAHSNNLYEAQAKIRALNLPERESLKAWFAKKNELDGWRKSAIFCKQKFEQELLMLNNKTKNKELTAPLWQTAVLILEELRQIKELLKAKQ